MPRPDYRFVPPMVEHLPALRRWRDAPQVRRWWPDFDEEIADVERGHAPEDFTRFVVETSDGIPFAWIQDYGFANWPMRHYPDAPDPDAPDGARGMDTLIGEPAFLGRGRAPRYIRQRAEELCAAGVTALVADPETANPRAIRAWRAAGFTGDRVVTGEQGRPVLILTFGTSTGAASPYDRTTSETSLL